jgi:hypothetical protein
MLLQVEFDLPFIWMALNLYLSLVKTTELWLTMMSG